MKKSSIPGIFTFILVAVSFIGAELKTSYYADVHEELLNIPRSSAMAGADLSIGSGVSLSSNAANLPGDSLHTISLSYASFFQNSFSTSLLSFSSSINPTLAYSISAGYIYIPDVEITESAETNEAGDPVYDPEIVNLSSILFRAGLGKRFSLLRSLDLSAGLALKAKRVRLPEYRGYGVAIDAGTRMQVLGTGVSIALVLENLASLTQWSDSYNEMAARHLRLGFGWEREFPYIYGTLRIGYTTPDLLSNEGVNIYKTEEMTSDIDIQVPSYEKVYRNPLLLITNCRFGLEYTIMKRLSLRGGLKQGSVHFGAGLNLFKERAGLDFSYAAHSLAGSYQLSLAYRW